MEPYPVQRQRIVDLSADWTAAVEPYPVQRIEHLSAEPLERPVMQPLERKISNSNRLMR